MNRSFMVQIMRIGVHATLPAAGGDATAWRSRRAARAEA